MDMKRRIVMNGVAANGQAQLHHRTLSFIEGVVGEGAMSTLMETGPAAATPVALSTTEAIDRTQTFLSYLDSPSLVLDQSNAEAYASKMDRGHGRQLESLVQRVSDLLKEGYAELSQRFNEVRDYDEVNMSVFFRLYSGFGYLIYLFILFFIQYYGLD